MMAPACICKASLHRPLPLPSINRRLRGHAGLAARLPTPHHRLHQTRRHSGCLTRCSAQTQTSSRGGQLRFIQHKEEAFVFYRFLSIFYDHIGALS